MITSLRLIRNVGQFANVAAGADVALGRLTLVYAENGRGKSTLCAIIRSLATGDPIPISERRRLAAAQAPQVVVDYAGGTPSVAIFQDQAWTRTLPGIAVFDEAFVNENVYSGLAVDADHRQNLHELIVGAAGVRINADLQGHVARIEEHNREIRQRSNAIPDRVRAGMSLDDFCALPARPTIEDDIVAAERALEEATQKEPIRLTASLPALGIPAFDIQAVADLLRLNYPALDARAATRVREHIAALGPQGHQWVSDGVQLMGKGSDAPCPFCAQPLGQSELVSHYRTFFGDEYANLRRAIEQMHGVVGQAHSDAAIAEYEARVETAAERRQFWLQFVQIPEPKFDLDDVVRQWRVSRDAVLRALERKAADPLERHEVDEAIKASVIAHATNVEAVAQLNARYHELNREIEAIKQRAAAGNVEQLRDRVELLRAVRARHEPHIAALCTALLDAKAAKILTEQARDSARAALERHRREVFPQYQGVINQYLERFGAGFRLAEVQAVDNRGGASCTYSVVINNQPIPVGGAHAPGQPYFGSALSAGDRNALALAFFFASLETDPGLIHRIVVIDDPVSSLDNHRTVTTIHAIRALADRVAQVVLLSHSKPFLLGVWEVTERINRAALEVARDVSGSTLRNWNVTADSETENDRRHAMLREYDSVGGGNPRAIAMALRPTLEAFMRVAFPAYFPAGSLLGPFVDRCRRQVAAGQPILTERLTNELWELVNYANRFHHDSNWNAHNEIVNDQELVGFVRRTLAFARR